MAMVFQNYALYPHMTVAQNLGFGLKLRGAPKDEIKRRVTEVARTLYLEPLLERKPAALSGGQRQRVAMGRAMVREPVAFLMDEPLSNLDAKLRVEMRAELARLRDRLKTTTLYVTHDQVEAMTLGDRVAVLKDGVLQQVDTPQRLFNEPTNLFVAAFIGSPSMNLVDARVEDGVVHFGPYSIPLPADRQLAAHADQRLVLGIRPHDFEDADVWKSDLPTIEVKADVTEELGSEVHVIFTVDALAGRHRGDRGGDLARGRRVRPARRGGGQDRRSPPAWTRGRSAAPAARSACRSIPGRFHFFERDSGIAIGAPSALTASAS